ncbi:MAG TPA: hypothetical protein VHV75_05915 [Solirubrobacteraceae bacterium]|jgi:hypothetical protein|nr:hypothetical protein [Solirubrobacteraceae bacterium]
MFRSATIRLAIRVSDAIDDMLVGDFDYILDAERVYADVDYYREHPHHEPDPTWTPTAGHGFGPQRPAVAGPAVRRPGTVAARPAECASLVRATGRPTTAAGRARAAH